MAPSADLAWYRTVLIWLTGRRGIGTFVSVIIHLFVCILLAMIVLQTRVGSRGEPIDIGFTSTPGELELVREEGVLLDLESSHESRLQTNFTPLSTEILRAEDMFVIESVSTPVGALPDPAHPLVTNTLSPPAMAPLLQTGGTTKSRTADIRKRGIPGREGDTTDQSERAVEAGLKWLSLHQLPDGGWAFDLEERDRNEQVGYCQGQCTNTFPTSSGASNYRRSLHPSRMAATALALLPFLGAGYTHQHSEQVNNIYQKTVHAGLEYLKYGTRSSENGYDFRNGLLGQGMYIQGIVTLTFCEAYEMTSDNALKQYAQEGLRFIEAAQREDGGWRYHARQDNDYLKDISGDTTVTGWQMLALKSGISAGLQVRTSVLYKVTYFLDHVQHKEGNLYHYLPIKNETGMHKMVSTTAVGLLLRLYLGWTMEKSGMKKGVSQLTAWITEENRNWQLAQSGKVNFRRGDRIIEFFGQTSGGKRLYVHNLYFSYYAMLVLHNLGGSDWHRSFKIVRDFLIETQSNQGHETGSWLFYDQYLNDGGRLLNTTLALLILETPYRYLPMYN